MQRRTFDLILSMTGVMLALGLLAAGALLMWGYSYANGMVSQQLAAQRIYFPAKNSAATKAAEFAPMRQYAGQLMTTGAQAEVYANYFIANHLKEIGGGKTYSQLSTEAQAQPKNVALATQVDTVFKGETLRSILLNAYAFWTFGQIALVAGTIAFGLAVVMIVLASLGFMHLRKVPAAAQLLAPSRRIATANP